MATVVAVFDADSDDPGSAHSLVPSSSSVFGVGSIVSDDLRSIFAVHKRGLVWLYDSHRNDYEGGWIMAAGGAARRADSRAPIGTSAEANARSGRRIFLAK